MMIRRFWMENEIIEKNNSELVIYETTDSNIKLISQ